MWEYGKAEKMKTTHYKTGERGLRFFFYSHDGLGLGHTRRNLAIASVLSEYAPKASIMLATGVDEVDHLGVSPRIEILKLPRIQKVANGVYVSQHLRIPSNKIFALRGSILKEAVKSFRPTVMLVDKHPLGVSGELRSALKALRAAEGRAVLGLRDILDDRITVLREWASYHLQDRIAEYYDRVLI